MKNKEKVWMAIRTKQVFTSKMIQEETGIKDIYSYLHVFEDRLLITQLNYGHKPVIWQVIPTS